VGVVLDGVGQATSFSDRVVSILRFCVLNLYCLLNLTYREIERLIGSCYAGKFVNSLFLIISRRLEVHR
jgi:hypothetical protein